MPVLVSEHVNPVKAPGLSLRTNFSWTLAGNLLYAASQWGFLILLAKLLNSAAVGEFAFALAVTAPIMIFANQGLTGLQATDAKREFSFFDYFVCRLVTTTIAFLVICLLSYFLHGSVVIIVVGAAKAVEALCDIRYGHYQQIDRMDRMAKSMMLRGAFSLAAAAAGLYLYRSVAWAAFGLVSANVAVLVFHDYREQFFSVASGLSVVKILVRRQRERGTSLFSRTSVLFLHGFPLGLAAMLSSLTSSIPRYFIEHYSGTAMLGVFAALMYLLIGGRTLIAALAQVCMAQLSRLYIGGDKRAFDRLLFRQLAAGLALGLLGILVSAVAGKVLLALLYRPEYADYSHVLILVMFAAALNYLAEFSNVGLLAVRALKVQPVILALCAASILILSYLLVPRFGITGGAWAIVITGGVQLAVTIHCLARAPFPRTVIANSNA